MLQAKIANVKVYAEPSREAKVVATLQRSDDLVATGEVKSGFVRVDSANFSGWVLRTLVGPAGISPVSAPAPTAPTQPLQAQAAPSVQGVFAGQFAGADQGTFNVTVLGNGVITGRGVSNNTGGFSVTGRMDPSGQVSMSAQGSAGQAVFEGRLDLATGQVTGNWRMLPKGGGGTFLGQRQS
jgi:hypothetical protein